MSIAPATAPLRAPVHRHRPKPEPCPALRGLLRVIRDEHPDAVRARTVSIGTPPGAPPRWRAVVIMADGSRVPGSPAASESLALEAWLADARTADREVWA